jgi:hypothetical protein
VWTPWQEVKIDCEDMPLTPIVWNGRLFLFWLRIVKGQSSTPAIGQTSGQDTISKWGSKEVGDYSSSAAGIANQITVNAVLCWSEFYNGKWQDMKTSDVNRPAKLDYPATAGDRNFELDRNRIRIVVAPYKENVPPDALVLAIVMPDDGMPSSLPYGPGFVLHNTHSQPVNSDDIKGGLAALGPSLGAIPLPLRALTPSSRYLGDQTSGTFSVAIYGSLASIGAGKPDSTLAVLGFPASPRYIQPQIGPGDTTDWPFFYEDKRNQFYVSIQTSFTPYHLWSGFAAASTVNATVSQIPHIPPLTTSPGAVAAIAAGSARLTKFVTVQNVAQSWSLAGGKQNVAVAFDSSAAFSFQGRVIGPSGGGASAAAVAAT